MLKRPGFSLLCSAEHVGRVAANRSLVVFFCRTRRVTRRKARPQGQGADDNVAGWWLTAVGRELAAAHNDTQLDRILCRVSETEAFIKMLGGCRFTAARAVLGVARARCSVCLVLHRQLPMATRLTRCAPRLAPEFDCTTEGAAMALEAIRFAAG